MKTDKIQEAIELFEQLTPENQENVISLISEFLSKKNESSDVQE